MIFFKIKRKLFGKVERFVYKTCVTDVSISCVRHDDKECYVAEGHGGRKVETWPIYAFYKAYLHGDVNWAKSAWIECYLEQYEKYKNVSKLKGGMLNGSLDRSLKALNLGNGNASSDILRRGIEKRVEERLRLADTIREEGYRPGLGDPVTGIMKTDRKLILCCGHHRVAVLAALDEKVVPKVTVYSKRF